MVTPQCEFVTQAADRMCKLSSPTLQELTVVTTEQVCRDYCRTRTVGLSSVAEMPCWGYQYTPNPLFNTFTCTLHYAPYDPQPSCSSNSASGQAGYIANYSFRQCTASCKCVFVCVCVEMFTHIIVYSHHHQHHQSLNRTPQMILQPVFSIFPCSPLPTGTCQTPGLSIP